MRALRLCLAPGGFLGARSTVIISKHQLIMENVFFGTCEKEDLGFLRPAPENGDHRRDLLF